MDVQEQQRKTRHRLAVLRRAWEVSGDAAFARAVLPVGLRYDLTGATPATQDR